MIYIGNHVSISLGYEGMLEKEKELGGNTFAFFTRNPRSFKDRKVSMEDILHFPLPEVVGGKVIFYKEF